MKDDNSFTIDIGERRLKIVDSEVGNNGFNIKNMGIDVKMVTGDHEAIAKELAEKLELGSNIVSVKTLEEDKGETREQKEELLEKVMEKGEIKIGNKMVKEISDYVKHRLSLLPEEHKRFENPHLYKIGISKKLFDLRTKLIEEFNKR